jgi:hypothetical protein
VSITTGELRGRVLFGHWSKTQNKVAMWTIVDRASLLSVQGYLNDDGTRYIVECNRESREDFRQGFSPERGPRVFDSIVEEDVDVIWTQHESGEWTRVPDALDGRPK